MNWKDFWWDMGDLLDRDPEERGERRIVTAEQGGITYEGTGVYSCGKLIDVEDIEIK